MSYLDSRLVDRKRSSELTLLQQLALPSIKWLLDSRAIGSGRTTLMAHAFVQLAIERPNTSIQIFDHFPNIDYKNLITEIYTICREKDIKIQYVASNRTIRVIE
jgi:hypothetical protein